MIQKLQLQVEINSAGWVAEAGLTDLVAMLTTNDILLVALFDWHGTTSAAQFCAQHIKKVPYAISTNICSSYTWHLYAQKTD